MYISMVGSGAKGFKQWAADHQPGSNDDDHPGGATPLAIAVALVGNPGAAQERPHRPWIVPGTTTSS